MCADHLRSNLFSAICKVKLEKLQTTFLAIFNFIDRTSYNFYRFTWYIREVEQTQLVRVRVCVTSLFVDDVIIICAPRTCATSYSWCAERDGGISQVVPPPSAQKSADNGGRMPIKVVATTIAQRSVYTINTTKKEPGFNLLRFSPSIHARASSPSAHRLYTFAWTCKLWSTSLSLRVEIVIIWRRESPLPLYQMVLGLFENDMIKQKRLESAKSWMNNNSKYLKMWGPEVCTTHSYILWPDFYLGCVIFTVHDSWF